MTFLAVIAREFFPRARQEGRRGREDGGTLLGQENLGQSEQLTTVRSKTLLNLHQHGMMLVVRRRTQ